MTDARRFDDGAMELLAERALGANVAELDPREERELEALLRDPASADEREALELAAAEVALVEAERAGLDEMPAGLAERLRHALSSPDTVAPVAVEVGDGADESGGGGTAGPIPISEAEAKPAGSGLSAALGWLTAAAAIAVAAVVFVTSNQPAPTGPVAGGGGDGAGVVDEAPVEERLATLERREGTVSWEWGPWPNDPGAPGYEGDAERVDGRVVWNAEAQEGYMVFENLKPNDPSEEQYQLWIVTSGEQEHPVDGGVFDVPTDGSVIVPIDPKLAVRRTPGAFGLTVEKPGGVVVSERTRRVVVAAPPPQG